MRVHGFVRPGFEAVREAFELNFAQGHELGASLCVVRRGETLLDIWAGEQDDGQPWRQDTIVNVFSVTKGAVALCCAICADRGLLDYNEKVATYWPEFAQNGKADITVAELLSHQAGLCGIRRAAAGEDGADFTANDFWNWEKICSQLARQRPYWPPGTRNGYHAVTFGWLVGELVRRVTGESVGTFFRKNVAERLGVDFAIGLPREEHHRVAPLIPPPPEIPSQTSSGVQKDSTQQLPPEKLELLEAIRTTFTNPTLGKVDGVLPFNSATWRCAEIPAANGHTNARALARMYCCLAMGGELDGVRLLSAGAVTAATRANCSRKDLILGHRVRFGNGFLLNLSSTGTLGPNLCAYGHAGKGGALGFADPMHGLGFGYTMNKMREELNGDFRNLRLIEALYGCLGQPMRYLRDKDGRPKLSTSLMSEANGNLTTGGKPLEARL